jgi:hypothetical protein
MHNFEKHQHPNLGEKPDISTTEASQQSKMHKAQHFSSRTNKPEDPHSKEMSQRNVKKNNLNSGFVLPQGLILAEGAIALSVTLSGGALFAS